MLKWLKQNTDNTKCWQGHGASGTHPADEDINATASGGQCGNILWFTIHLAYDSAILLLGTDFKDDWMFTQKCVHDIKKR